MKPRIATLSLVFVTFLGTCSAIAQKPDKYALLVAVNDYDHSHFSDLSFPEADAKAIGKILESNGYDVDDLLGKHASKRAIEDALKKLRKRGGNGGVAFIGIFGHGVEFENPDKSYFCPHDCRIRQSEDSDGNKLFDNNGQPLLEPERETLVATDEYIAALRDSRAANRILIADCCRDAPNRARSRSFGSAMQLNALPENTAVFFACSKNQKAYEEPFGHHGVFTKCLLKPLEEGQSLMSSIAAEVAPAVHRFVEEIRERGQPEQKPAFFQTGTNVDLLLVKGNKPTNPHMDLQADVSRVANSINLELVRIPNGRKDMDYDYYLAKHEVTQGQYELVMGTNPSKNQHGKNLPVEQVSFLDAKEFCRKLTELEIKDGKLPPGMVYRLPWKREWEVAHGKNIDQLSPNELQKVGWFGNKNQERATRRIGNSNDLEIHDLFGNVAEWCLDQELDDDTKDPMHLAVGGSFFITPETFLKQPKERNVPGEWLAPDAKRYDVGFRVVLGPAILAQQAK